MIIRPLVGCSVTTLYLLMIKMCVLSYMAVIVEVKISDLGLAKCGYQSLDVVRELKNALLTISTL